MTMRIFNEPVNTKTALIRQQHWDRRGESPARERGGCWLGEGGQQKKKMKIRF